MDEPKRRMWSEADDAALTAAIEVLSDARLPDGIALWQAVAARLLPGIVVTPSAARSRWERMCAQREAEARANQRAVVDPKAAAAWERVAQLAERAEQDSTDRMIAALEGIRDELAEIRGDQREQGRILAGLGAAFEALRKVWE